MNINKNNYEEIFIDYYDGNLTAEEVAELFLFLESHPDLKTEFESFNNISLESSSFEFPFKEELKKEEINKSNFSHYMIASLEGDLSVREIKMLEAFLLANPTFEKEIKLFQATRLTAADEIFPGKNKLKQPVPMMFNFNKVAKYAVAAILLLSFVAGAYFMITKSNEKSAVEFAQLPVTNPDTLSNLPDKNDSIFENSPIAPENNSVSAPGERFEKSNQVQLAQENDKKNFKKFKRSVENQSPVEDPIQPEPLPVASADIIELKSLPVKTLEQQAQESSPVAQVSTSGHSAEEKYVSVWEALRQASDRKLQKLNSDDSDALAIADENSSPRNSVINLLEKGIEKVSNDKVAINTQNDHTSDVSRFSFSLGNFKIEKDRVK
ncbi:MAG TPA: hypothetical protein PKD91_07610 [Bacteroidia bacterium]|nr:hypothetical protein [Bacteroidia bacterium]